MKVNHAARLLSGAMSPDRPRWFRRKLFVGIAVTVFVFVGAAAVFALTHQPGDISHPDVEFRAEPTGTPVPDQSPSKAKGGDPLAKFVWPDYGYTKDRRRYMPASFQIRPPFKRLWTRVAPVLLEFSPILVGPGLYNLDNNAVAVAYDKRTGKTRWQRKLGVLSASSPAFGGGRLYYTVLQRSHSVQAGRVAALRPKNGKVIWSKDLPSRTESSPLFDGGRIYFGSENGTVYAVNARNGSVAWTFRASGAVKAGLALSDGKLYFGAYGGRAYCIRESDGKLVWSTGTSGRSFGLAGGNFYSTPAVAFGRMYVGNTDGRMYSFSAASGKLAWARETGAYVYGSPAVAQVPGGQPMVWFGSYNGTFYAVDARSGNTRWTFRSGGRILGGSTVVGNIVYFSDYGKRTTYGLNVGTGKLEWRYPRGAFNPVISDGRSIYLTGHSALYKFRPKGIAADAVPKPTTLKQVQTARKQAKARKAAARRRYVAFSRKQRAKAIKYCKKQKHPRRCFAKWRHKHPYQDRAGRVKKR
jgi:outer membrane protein assembly factor BamB